MSEEWVAAELSGSAAVRSSMAGIDLVGAHVDLVGARVLPALSSLAACTRPWWPRTTTTARQHSTHHHHRMWAEWWPTGARPDVAAGVLEGARVVADGGSVGCGRRGSGGARVVASARRGSGGACVVVLRSVSIVVSVDERQR